MSYDFFVAGTPVPKGSARAYIHGNRAIVRQTNAARQKPWASMITHTAIEEGVKPHDGPVVVYMRFRFPRPKKHYKGKAKTLRFDAPEYHTNTPDVDKLVRLVFDALTSVAWQDDRQAQIGMANKMYVDEGNMPGVSITLRYE